MTIGPTTRLLTQAELCERWQLSRYTLRNLRDAGKLPFIRFSFNVVRYALADVIAFEEQHLNRADDGVVQLSNRRTR